MKKYINILCVLILALMLADFSLDFFFTSEITFTKRNLDSFSLTSLLCLLFASLAAMGAMIMAFICFIRFILNVNRNEVFTRKNISLLRKYGVCALIAGISMLILSLVIITGNSLGDALSDSFDALGEGFFALLMGEIFSIGMELQEKK